MWRCSPVGEAKGSSNMENSMYNKKAELLDYIRVLHDRQASKASKAGMTSWAVLAGVIYAIWHLLDYVSEMPIKDSSGIEILYAFSQIYMAIISLNFLVSQSHSGRNKKNLDYRIFQGDDGVVQVLVVSLFILGLPLSAILATSIIDMEGLPFPYQADVNFWVIVILSVLIGIYSISRIRAHMNNKLPHIAGIFGGESLLHRISSFFLYILFLEMLIGNVANIAYSIFSHMNYVYVYVVAFDIALIVFGLIVLYRNSITQRSLSRMACLERDIVIHNLSDDQILDRLQDEFLGSYVGDWLERLIKEIKEEGASLSQHALSVDDLISEVNLIDSSYEKERKGRINDFLVDIENRFDRYDRKISPLLAWLKEASVHASMHKDQFVKSIVLSSADDLGQNSKDAGKKVKDALAKLREWMRDN
jgi:hypothetical protein